jgi:hypothetical protein
MNNAKFYYVRAGCWSRRWPSGSCCCWNAGDRRSAVTRHTHDAQNELKSYTSFALRNRTAFSGFFHCLCTMQLGGLRPSPATARLLLDPVLSPCRATCTTTISGGDHAPDTRGRASDWAHLHPGTRFYASKHTHDAGTIKITSLANRKRKHANKSPP